MIAVLQYLFTLLLIGNSSDEWNRTNSLLKNNISNRLLYYLRVVNF